MNMNRKFGKLIDGKLTYAPKVIVRKHSTIICPSKKVYEEDGWLEIVDQHPANADGFSAVAVGWKIDGDAIKRQYELKPMQMQAVANASQKGLNIVQRALRAAIKKMLGCEI